MLPVSQLGRLALALALLLGLAGCFPSADDGRSDGGGDGGSASDGGDRSDGGTSVDGGGDGGGCPPGGCVTECTPGEQRCDGQRVQSCVEDGWWGASARCVGGLCRGDRCVATTSCASEVPPCCALPEDCGGLRRPFTCDECRPIVEVASCLAGECIDEPGAGIDVVIRADAGDLLAEDRIAVTSGVLTSYRGVGADGQVADCSRVFVGGAHEARDPTLNATMSRHFNYATGTGNDLFDARVLGFPAGDGQTVVVTVYEGFDGTGRRLARGCTDGVAPRDEDVVVVTLVP